MSRVIFIFLFLSYISPIFGEEDCKTLIQDVADIYHKKGLILGRIQGGYYQEKEEGELNEDYKTEDGKDLDSESTKVLVNAIKKCSRNNE